MVWLPASFGVLLIGLGLFLTSLGLYYRLTHGAADAPSLPGLGPSEPPEIPDELDSWISQESEPFARRDLRSKARSLYAEHGDWAVVQAELYRETVGGQPDPTESLNHL